MTLLLQLKYSCTLRSLKSNLKTHRSDVFAVRVLPCCEFRTRDLPLPSKFNVVGSVIQFPMMIEGEFPDFRNVTPPAMDHAADGRSEGRRGPN